MHYADSKYTFNVSPLLTRREWKKVLSNVCLGCFGADAILAHAEAWDLALWKMSQEFHGPSFTSICFIFLYFRRKVNTIKTSEMCIYLHSDVWVGCFTIILAGSFHYFKPVSCRILFCEKLMLQAFHDLSINFPSRLKLLKCAFISTQTFEADVSQLFLLDLFLTLSFLPN